VWLDVSLNHFGHNYLFYGFQDDTTVAQRIRQGQNLNDLWDFDKTYDHTVRQFSIAPKSLPNGSIV
jgi:hypothetical protein